MNAIRRPALLVCALTLLGCGRAQEPEPDAYVAAGTDATDPTETKPLGPGGVIVLSIAPSDMAGIPAPERTKTLVTPAWDYAYLAERAGGFSLQPRLTIELSGGPIDADTVAAGVHLQRVGTEELIGVQQIVIDPESLTISAVPVRYLREESEYLVVVTDALHAAGGPVVATTERFTTGRFTSALVAIREALDATPLGPATLVAESPSGAFTWEAHRATLPAGSTPTLPWTSWEPGGSLSLTSTYAEAGDDEVELELESGVLTGAVPPGGGPVRVYQRFEHHPNAAIGALILGHFDAPWYLTQERLFAWPEATQEGTRTVWFWLYLPPGDPPGSGWPIALFGNGYRSHRHHAGTLAADLATHGVATLALTAVGHGGGPDGRLVADGIAHPDGGRAIDADGDGFYGLEEGMRADPTGPSHGGVAGLTDGVRQTVIEMMAASRVVAQGLPNVSTAEEDRFYFGISNGGRVGALLLAVDPTIRVGVLNVPPTEAHLPLNDSWRSLWADTLDSLVPPLTNAPHPEWGFFDEAIPFRGDPPLVAPPEGAADIQDFLDRYRWATLPMNPAAYGTRLREATDTRVLVQIGRGDRVVPNPASIDLVREADLQATTCIVWPQRSLWDAHLGKRSADLIHVFAFMLETTASWQPGVIGAAARTQIATWYTSRGEKLVDPDPEGDLFGQGDVFEVPVSDESLELLNRDFGY